jgi:hypothetical protein
MEREFYVGQQVVYIPDHLKDNLADNLDSIEFGFITSIRDDVCFCRYWIRGKINQLRTIANSESTNKRDLFPCKVHSQDLIDQMIEEIKKDV